VSKSYLNKVELKGGKILLYHRPNSKKPIYHMRIQVHGMRDMHGEIIPYFTESTREQDLEEAQRVALDKYDELRLRVKAKQPARSITWAEMYELWFKEKREGLEAHYRAKGRTGKNARVDWFEKYSARYWLPYFGKYNIEDISQRQVQGYWTWRTNYWANATDAERKKYANHAINPAKKSLDMEQSALREVFAWANANKLVSTMPIIENPYARKGIAPTRRASIDADDWVKLMHYLAAWSAGKGKNDVGPNSRINSAHLYQRELLMLYIAWISTTGMRTGEVLLLKHKDIGMEILEETQSAVLKIRVSAQTKTGSRIVTSQQATTNYYEDLCNLTGREDDDDWLFCNRNGTHNKGFMKTLTKVLAEAGVLYDAEGGKRSAYSFRHYYAEQRFAEIGINPKTFDLLSVNMGTGRQMLESYYIRKGMVVDDEALIATGANAPRKANRKVDSF
jgi:integrase